MKDRVETIRTMARAERERIFGLDEKLHHSMKQLLQPATCVLDDIDEFFLGALLQVLRTSADKAKWLDLAEARLHQAVQQRLYVEDIVNKFGPDARLLS